MSQAIRKLQNGDNIVRIGTRKYKYDDIASKASGEVDSFMDIENYKQEEREAFTNAYADLLAGMKDGTIHIDDSGRMVDTKGRYKNVKNPNFDAYGHAVRFIKEHIPSLTAYTDPKKDETKVKTFGDTFRGMYFGGRSADSLTEADYKFYIDFDKKNEDGSRGTAVRYGKMANASTAHADYLMSIGKTEEAQRFYNLAAKLNDGQSNYDDIEAAAATGMPMATWNALMGAEYSAPVEKKTETELELERLQEQQAAELKEGATQEEIDKIKAEQAARKYEEDYKLWAASDANDWLRLGRIFETDNPNKYKDTYQNTAILTEDDEDTWTKHFEKNPNARADFFNRYIPALIDNLNKGQDSQAFITGKKGNTSELLGKALAYGQQYLNKTDDGSYILWENSKDGTVYTYNPAQQKIRQVAGWRLQRIRDLVRRNYDMLNKPIDSFQQGGILSANNTSTWWDEEAFNRDVNAYRQQRYEELKKGAEAGGYDNIDDYETFTSTPEGSWHGGVLDNPYQNAQIAALIADGVSLASAFIPGGNTISAISGAVGTLAQFGADQQDGFQGKDVWNLVSGLAGDAVSVVPFVGNAFKISRAGSFLQKFRRMLPLIMQVPSIVTAAANIPGAGEAIRKIADSEEDLTVQDWQALGHFLTNAASATIGLKSAVNANRMLKTRVSNNGTPEKWSIKGSKGEEISLTKEQYDHVLSLKKEDDINNYLKELNLKDAEGNFLKAKINKSLLKGSKVEGKHQKAIEGYDFSDISDDELKDMSWWKNATDRHQYKKIRKNLGQDPKGETVSDFDSAIMKKRNETSKNEGTPKQEAPAEQPKTETPKQETPKQETPKTETPKQEASAEQPKQEAVAEQPKTETPKQNKQKNNSSKKKKKKKKHDKGGVIEYLKILKGQSGISTPNPNDHTYNNDKVMYRASDYLNTAAKILNSWWDATDVNKWDNYYKMDKIRQDADTYLKTTNGADLAKTLNHLNSFNDAKMWEKKNLNGIDYTKFNESFKKTGLNQFFGEDVSKFQYMGPSTWNRKAYLDELNKKGSIQTSDGELRLVNGQWKLFGNVNEPSTKLYNGPTSPAEIMGLKPGKTGESYIYTSGGNQGEDNNEMPKFESNVNKWIPEVIAAGRLIGTLQSNKEVAKKQKESIKPYLPTTYQLYGTLNDYYTLGAVYDKTADNMVDLAARNVDADSALNRGSLLQQYNASLSKRLEGQVARYQAMQTDKSRNLQISAGNVERATTNANQAGLRMNAADSAKKQIDAALIGANWNSVDTYMKEHEKRMRDHNTKLVTSMQEFNLGELQDWIKTSEDYQKASNILEQYEKWRKISGNELKSMKEWNEANYKKYLDFTDNYKKLYRQGVYQIKTAKDGSKIRVAQIKARTEAAKEFQKDIHESIKNHIHMINNLSSVTKELILTAMT